MFERKTLWAKVFPDPADPKYFMTGTYVQARSKCSEENQKYNGVLPIDVPIPRDQAEMESLAKDDLFSREPVFIHDSAWLGIRLVWKYLIIISDDLFHDRKKLTIINNFQT